MSRLLGSDGWGADLFGLSLGDRPITDCWVSVLAIPATLRTLLAMHPGDSRDSESHHGCLPGLHDGTLAIALRVLRATALAPAPHRIRLGLQHTPGAAVGRGAPRGRQARGAAVALRHARLQAHVAPAGADLQPLHKPRLVGGVQGVPAEMIGQETTRGKMPRCRRSPPAHTKR